MQALREKLVETSPQSILAVTCLEVNISGCAADSVHRNTTADSVNVDFGLAVLPAQELKTLRHDQTSD